MAEIYDNIWTAVHILKYLHSIIFLQHSSVLQYTFHPQCHLVKYKNANTKFSNCHHSLEVALLYIYKKDSFGALWLYSSLMHSFCSDFAGSELFEKNERKKRKATHSTIHHLLQSSLLSWNATPTTSKHGSNLRRAGFWKSLCWFLHHFGETKFTSKWTNSSLIHK